MNEGHAGASWGFVSFVCKLGGGVTIGQKDHLPSFPVTPCEAEQALGAWPTGGAAGSSLRMKRCCRF